MNALHLYKFSKERKCATFTCVKAEKNNNIKLSFDTSIILYCALQQLE